MKKNILIFPAGTEVGLEIERSLRDITHLNIIGANSISDHSEFIYKDIISGLPYIYDKNFLASLNKLIRENKINFIYPAHDDVVNI
ncbi:hypothetical protein N9X24_03120 [Rickettsiales bacterium]|nr:hypothetical protein [Rickettsiales bacterium]